MTMTSRILTDIHDACKGQCPKCRQGRLFKRGFTVDFEPECPECGFDYSAHDCGDGPAVFLIFVLGFLMMPLALVLDHFLEPPMWAQALIWGLLAIGICVGSLRPLRAYLMILQYRHQNEIWK